MKKNKNAFKNFSSFMIGLIVIFCVSYAFYEAMSLFFSLITKLEKEIAAAIIAAMTTIIVSVLSIILAKYYEKKKAFEMEIRAKKIPVYEKFINFTFRILNKEISPENTDEFNKFFMDFTQELIVWGSDEVIHEWSNYRLNASNSDQVLTLLENVLYAIRKDTGHKNNKLKKNDLLCLFLNDISTFQKK